MSTRFHRCPTMDFARGLTQYRMDTLESILRDLNAVEKPDEWQRGRKKAIKAELKSREVKP